MSRRRWPLYVMAGALVLLGAAGLLHLSLAARHHGVEVCLTYHGQDACGRAWAGERKEALRGAARSACSTIARGVGETIACSTQQATRVTWLDPADRGARAPLP